MNRLLKLAVAGSFLAAGFIGCGLLDAVEDTTPTITLDAIGSIGVGNFKNVEGEVKAGENITSISYSVEDESGTAVALTKIKATGPTSKDAKKLEFKDNDAIKIEVFSGASDGNYKLKITVTAGTTVDASFDFTVTGGSTGTALSLDTTLIAGANKNSTLGSSIDLDAGAVWLMAAAKTNLSDVDICYAHTASNGDKVGSAQWALSSGYDFTANWSNPPDMKMHMVTMTSAEYDAVDSKEAIEVLWVEASGVTSLTVETGDVFIVKTTKGALALVWIQAQVAGETGSITIKVAK